MPRKNISISGSFAGRLIRWHKAHGRHGLPWQKTRDPYRVWLSEIMLQQTQVGTVIPYYEKFLKCFPTVKALAAASLDEVLGLWSGLGYYSRARNLHKAAQIIVRDRHGKFPGSFEEIAGLPGVGRSTAGAIAAFAFGERRPILDGNVKRVLARYFCIEGVPTLPAVDQKFWTAAEQLLPRKNIEVYTQALMDLGATLCTRAHPGCNSCPLSGGCQGRIKNRVHLLPTPKVKKERPRRSVHWIVIQRVGAFLLVKRPSEGIWGGLWSFPEAENREGAAKRSAKEFGVGAGQGVILPPLVHAFTHFTLTIHPLLFTAPGGPRRRLPGAAKFFGLREALAAGLPAPVRGLLETLGKENLQLSFV